MYLVVVIKFFALYWNEMQHLIPEDLTFSIFHGFVQVKVRFGPFFT
jgi:hypothetical protein